MCFWRGRITAEPEQPDRLPEVAQTVLPLSVSPSERQKTQERRQREDCKPEGSKSEGSKPEGSRPDESSCERPAPDNAPDN